MDSLTRIKHQTQQIQLATSIIALFNKHTNHNHKLLMGTKGLKLARIQPEPTDIDISHFSPNQEELLKLAYETVHAGNEFTEKFRSMVHFIRQQELSPVEITPVLLKAGFAKSRCSEIKTLACVPQEIWHAYETKQIGWHATLEKAREAKPPSANGPRKVNIGKICAALITKHAQAVRRAKKSKLKFCSVNDGQLIICCPLSQGQTSFDLGKLYKVEIHVTALDTPDGDKTKQTKTKE